MARIQYGPENNPVELQMVRIINLQMFPEMDPSGTDRLMTRVELEVAFQWSPWATSSNSNNSPTPPFDFPGLSVQMLHQALTQPRQTFRFMLGPDVVWEVPDVLAGVRLPCDPGLGPYPGQLALRGVEGDKLAVGTWKIRFYVTDCSNILLSNRWTVTADTNACGMTSRTVEGWAIIRADALAAARAAAALPGGPNLLNSVDDFRRWFIVPCPLGFRREKVKVIVNESGTRARYRCLDVQDPNPLGGNTVGVARMTGEVTAGYTDGQTSWKAKGGATTDFVANIVGGLFNPFGAVKGVAHDLISKLPQQIASGWVKVEGQKDCPKTNLLMIAIGVLLDRFPGSTVVSCVATQGIGMSQEGGRWVKAAMTCIPRSGPTFANAKVNYTKIDQLMSFQNTIIPNVPGMPGTAIKDASGRPYVFPGDTPANDQAGVQYGNANLPAGTRPGDASGSRGSWLGELMSQNLFAQCEPPDAPPANQSPALLAPLV